MCQRAREITKERQVLLRMTSKFLWMSSYNMQKGSHLVWGMFMLVGAEKKIWAGGTICWAPARKDG